MNRALESNKTKIAKRVIEVFEFFGANHRSATVMDIVRRYDRPQSSTSELLSSLVEMGLLYKDPRSRRYSPTPRLATLGSAAQPDQLRNGRIYAFMDRLAQSTRFGVGLFGMVGTHTQVFRWAPGEDRATAGIDSGDSELLSSSAVGLLLLSTIELERARKVLWRLNAEAGPSQRFDYAAVTQRVIEFSRHRVASGGVGFASDAQVTCALLPRVVGERPLAIGVVHPASAVDAEALAATLRHGVAQSIDGETYELPATTGPLLRAV